MSVKEYLSQAYRLDQRINSKLEQIKSLRDLAAKATFALSDVCILRPNSLLKLFIFIHPNIA